MGWRILGESRRFDSDDDEIREAYEEGCRKGYKKAMKEIHEGGEYGERDDWDDDDDEYGERGGSYGMRGGYGMMDMGGYGERQGVRGTGPYSRVTRAGYVRRGRGRRY
jgi:hypothetical protein